MISLLCVTNRIGGLDVLFSSLREQTDQGFEVLLIDDLFWSRKGLPPQVGAGTWHMSPGGDGPRWGSYMRALNRSARYARGEVLLVVSDYSCLHSGTVAAHAAFHASHGPREVMLGGIQYAALPPLHPDFPLRYGWGAIGYDPANHDDAKHAPWLDKKRRHGLYEEWRVAYEADLASGILAPFMHSTFATPITSYADTAGLKVWSRNDRSAPNNFLSLKNDSFKRSLLTEIGGFDERADGTHGHQDSITHRHMVKVGAAFHAVPENPVRILDAHGIAIIRRAGLDDEANLKLAEALQ